MSGISASFLENRSLLGKFLARFFSRHQDIEDVLQETYLRAFDAEKSREIRSPKSFLFRVARNIALNELSRKSSSITDYIATSAPEILALEQSAELVAGDQEKLAVFCRAAASLPTQCRKAFLMRKVYGVSQKEIAQRLGISVSTVEKHVAIGLMRCTNYMTDRGFLVAEAAGPAARKQSGIEGGES